MIAANVPFDKTEFAGSKMVEPGAVTSWNRYITDGRAQCWQWMMSMDRTVMISHSLRRNRDTLIVITMFVLTTYALASAYFTTCLGGVVSRQVQPSSPFVTLKNGSYAGLHSPQYDQDFFLGLPYAQASVSITFRPPLVCQPNILIESRTLHSRRVSKKSLA